MTQRWIVAALGALVVAVAVILMVEWGGDQADLKDEAPAVAASPAEPASVGETESGGEAPASTQAAPTQSDSDQVDAAPGDAAADSTAATEAATTTDSSSPEAEPETAVADGGSQPSDEPEGGEPESGAVSVAIDDQTEAAKSADKDSQIAALPDSSSEAAPAMRPSFDIVRVEGNGEAVLAGRAEPGSSVTVYDGDASFASVVADSNGNWVLLTERPLAAGSHELTLRSRSPTGIETESADAVIVVVPGPPRALAEAAPQADTPEAAAAPATIEADAIQAEATGSDGETSDTQEAGDQGEAPATAADALAVLVPREGSGASQVLQQPESDGIKDDQLVLLAVDYDAAGRIVVSGRAAPGALVIAYLDNQAVGQSSANDTGRWVIAPEGTIAPGLHKLRIDQVDASGAVIARVETPFSRAEMLTALPGERFVIVQPGNSLWRIARRTYGSGFRYTVIYQSNVDQIRDPDLIYPGQVFMLPQETPKVN